MADTVLLQCEEQMEKAIEKLGEEFSKVRTGRANPAILNSVMIECYGAMSPVQNIATVSVSEGRSLVIKPFDKSTLKSIEDAINMADLNLVPNNNGEVIRINFPAITEETRKELVKDVKKAAENIKVTIRNVRKDSNEALKKLGLTEDDEKGYQDDVQELTNKYNKKVDELLVEKEKDLMTI